jgi:hypothetical protein
VLVDRDERARRDALQLIEQRRVIGHCGRYG